MIKVWTTIGTAFVAAALVARAPAQEMPAAARAVKAEALKPNAGPEGRPLPLAAHWHSRDASLDYQLELLARGHHILPFSYMLPPRFANDEERLNAQTKPGMEAAMRKLAAWKMPFVLITGGQWEADLYANPEFRNLPPERNPCVIDAETGEIKSMVSPFGPPEVWRELGRQWGGTRYFQWLADIYPDPPMVVLVSNNEAHDLRWHALETSKRYMERYGAGRSDDFKRKLLDDLYYERYRAMFAGIREGLPNETWRENVVIAAYGGGPGPDHLGRGPDLDKWLSVIQEERPPRNTWEGALPEFYDNHWERDKFDHHVWSCQVEAMNIVFMKQRALRADPDWWMEAIFWDGGAQKAVAYEDKGMLYTPERYGAWAACVLWTLTPRAARQWNGYSEPRESWLPQFGALMRAVDLVHADPDLARFWRKGELVVNPEGGHPFDYEFPAKWKEEDRWFRLSTDRDPPRPWDLTTRLPVFALARVLGGAPDREWLLYAHAPLGDLTGVGVTIPGWQTVSLDVPLAGAHYLVREADGSIAEVGRPESLDYAGNRAPEARDDAFAVAAGDTLEVTPYRFSGGGDLLDNDTDYEGDALSVSVEAPPRHGALSLKPDGSFAYRPDPGFEGDDGFSYRATDGRDRSEPATVSLRVLGKPVAIVDDSAAGFTGAAFPNRSEGDGHAGDFTYFVANSDLGRGSLASWTFDGLEPDTYEVFATWPEFSYQRPRQVPYELIDGSMFRARVLVSQEAAPAGPEHDGSLWQSLGAVTVDSGVLRVELSNAAAGRWVVADAVRVVGRRTGKTATVDDGDDGFAALAAWNERPAGYAGSSRWTMARNIPKAPRGEEPPHVDFDAGTWEIDGLEPGTYALYATWPADTAAKTAVYEAYEGETRLLRANAAQTAAPRDLYASGAWWQRLGEVTLTADALRVELVAATPKHKPRIVADAVALFRLGADDEP